MQNTFRKFIKRYRWYVVAVVCVVVCLGAFGWFGRPAGEFKRPESGRVPDKNGNESETGQGAGASVPNELVGIFETEEQALEAAELYGIELKSYEYGVAVFKCEGEPSALIKKGERNGWPQLSLNNKYQALQKNAGER